MGEGKFKLPLGTNLCDFIGQIFMMGWIGAFLIFAIISIIIGPIDIGQIVVLIVALIFAAA